MTSMATKSSGVCDRLRSVLGGLCCECAIVTLTLVSVLAVSGEMLVDHGILTVPPTQTTTPTESNASSNGSSSGGEASTGGTTSSLTREEEDRRQIMDTVRLVFHYISFAIAIAFSVEMALKLALFRKRFFRKHWQILDMLVVVATICVEIAFEVTDRIPELEACTFVVVFRLIRLPHTCSIKAKRVQRDMEQDIDLWKAGKCKVEDKCTNLEAKNNKQKEKIDRLERELLTLKKEKKDHQRISDQAVTPNGSVPHSYGANSLTGSSESLDSANHVTSSATRHVRRYVSMDSEDDDVDTVTVGSDGFTPSHLHSVTTRQNSKGTETVLVEEDDDSGGMRHPSRYFRSGSESSLSCQGALEHEVHVQIEGQDESHERVKVGEMGSKEEDTPGRRDSSQSTPQRMRKQEEKHALITADDSEANSGVCYDNSGYDGDDLGHDGVLVHEIDGAKTYRSADGIPMTDL